MRYLTNTQLDDAQAVNTGTTCVSRAVSGDADKLREACIESYFSTYLPVIYFSLVFHTLSEKWKHDTVFTSSIDKIVSHPAYLKIISMGRGALPFIIRELQKDPRHWFVALQSITGENPVPLEHLGRVDKMTEDWLNWAENNV